MEGAGYYGNIDELLHFDESRESDFKKPIFSVLQNNSNKIWNMPGDFYFYSHHINYFNSEGVCVKSS